MKMTKTLAVLTTLSFFAGPAWPELTRIGGAGAVRGSVNAVSEGTTVGRLVQSGKPLFLNDHVTTKNESHLQVMLLDESVFTLGPNSDMVLDEFVYDPATSAGKVTAKLTKGVFRFVTGKVARQAPTNMKITVPTGTIGIRGTKGAVEVKPGSALVILEGAGKKNTANETPGKLEIKGDKGDSQMLTKEGFGSELPEGGAATPPSDHSADLARLNGVLSPKPSSNTAPPGGGKKDDASSETGGVVKALGSLADTKTTGDEGDSNAQVTTQASQTNPIVDGLTTWEFIEANIKTGTGFFFSCHAPVTCSANCATANPGVLGSVQLYIDFGAQTIGGSTAQLGPSGISGSFIHVHGVSASGAGDTIQQIIGIGGGNQTPIPFGSGSAILTLNGTNLGSTTATNGGGGSFNGSTISLQNSGGVVAATSLVNFQFSGTNSSAQSVSVTGTFNAPRQ